MELNELPLLCDLSCQDGRGNIPPQNIPQHFPLTAHSSTCARTMTVPQDAACASSSVCQHRWATVPAFSTQLLWEGSPAAQWVLQLVCFPETFIQGYSLFLCPPQYSLYKATGWTLWEQTWCWAGSTEGPGSAASHGKPAYPLSEADTQWWRLETLGIPKPICIRSLKAGRWECFWTTKAMPRTKP